MKLQFLLLLFFPLLFSAQKSDIIHDKEGKATFEFYKKTKPSLETGVLGAENKKAFAIFINEKSLAHSPEIFSKVQFETMNFDGKKSTVFLCIYENDNGLPGKILDEAKIIIEIPIKNTEIVADLSPLKIKVPTNGYFIGFEWILSKKNMINGSGNAPTKAYNPAITGVQNENLFVFDENWKKEKDQLASSLKIDVDYLPEN